MNQSQGTKNTHRGVLFGALLLLVNLLITAAQGSDSENQVVISNVVVNRSNIFETSDVAAGNPQQVVAITVNRFHKTTLESVILREVGVRPGDSIPVAEVDEIERRLRDLGIFASVAAALVTADTGVELHITTRDNFSLVAGATGSFLGGVGNVGFTVGERNVLGTGNSLRFGLSRSTTDTFRGSVAFSDLHFFEKPWQAEYAVGRTNDGDFFGFELSDSFRTLGSGREWSLTVDYIERLRKYFIDGDTVFELPEDRSRLLASHVWRSGEPELLFRRGLEAGFTQSVYSSPEGVFGELTQPEDTRRFYIGGLLATDRIRGYKKVLGLDTLRFVQDVRFGTTAEVRLGANLVDDFNTAEASRVDPEVAVVLDNVTAMGEHSLLRMTLSGSAIVEETGERPWSATARLRAFNTAINNTTIAFNADYSTGEDGSELPVQLTLGEGNGLRGYDLRQFQGRQRLRMNLEARYYSGWKLGILDVGLIGFADAGWAAARNNSSVSLNRSIGTGLRLASNSLLGSRVIRIDLAFPLDTPEGDSSEPSFSAAVGQVFRF